MRATSIIAVAAICVSASACAAIAPPQPKERQTAAVAQAQTTHELPTPAPPQTVDGPAASSPEQAVRRFANAYINWTAESVERDMRTLAAASTGQARSAMQLAAAQTAGDYELKRGGIANSGSVEAVAPLAGARDRYVVVTRETTTATAGGSYQGLRPAWHVALATVVDLPGEGWALSSWQPES